MKLTQIRGQKQPISILSQAVRHQKVAHAYLFSGPDGVGKKTTALSLAQALNCHQQGGDACMECSSCRKIEQGQHPDVQVIKPEGEYIKIEAIRRLQQEMASKPYEGRVKTQVIDEADRLTPQAANCLLKTLEEPASNSLLILVSAHPYNLLPTVVSRCQRLVFNQLAAEDIEQLLSGKGLSPAQCQLIASFCQGSPAQVLELDIEQVLAEREELVGKVFGRLPLSEEELLDCAQALAGDKERIERLLKWLLLWYRDLLVIRKVGEEAWLVNGDKRPELSRQAAQHTLAELHQKLEAVEHTREHLKRHVNPQLALEVMFMDLNLGYQVRNNHEVATL
jgi:DNA polymerase-3 subunit delta'